MQDQDICRCEPGCKIPYGYCHDGCGQLAGVYARTNKFHGQAKGQPKLYLPGHHTTRRGPKYEERDLGYVTPCWFWLGRPNAGGYGHFDQDRYAHQVYYERYVGPIPEGLGLDHLCHNADKTCPGGPDCLHRRCCNPSHLKPKTHKANHRAGRKTKLTAEEVRDIRSREWYWGIGEALAKEFGVHPTTISDILNNRTWVDTDS